MSDKKRRHRHKISNGKSFLILPIIFFVLTYLVLYCALAPSTSSLLSAAGMFFSDNEKDFSTDYENIFVPMSEPTDETTTNKPVNISSFKFPSYGNQFGQLIINDCKIDAKLFFGDGDIALRNGVGVYNGSFIPGYGRTILIAGHNNTFFNGLKYAEEGQLVTIRTSYGNYTYKITGTAVKKYDDSSAYDLTANKESLVMYTCYPFDEIGYTYKRFFVYAEPVSGAEIDKNTQEVQ